MGTREKSSFQCYFSKIRKMKREKKETHTVQRIANFVAVEIAISSL
jgi:hypothetical protein